MPMQPQMLVAGSEALHSRKQADFAPKRVLTKAPADERWQQQRALR